MSKQMRELQARKSTLVQEARALTERAATDNRDMSDEEVSAFDALKTRIDSASSAIERESSLIAEEAQMAIGALNHARTAHITVTDNRQADHFSQVFEIADTAGWADKSKSTHIGFGMMLGADAALTHQMVDGVATLDDLISKMRRAGKAQAKPTVSRLAQARHALALL